MQVAEARRAGKPDWINVRTVLGLTLFAVALATGSMVLRSAEAATMVWAAGRDLAEGTPLGETALELVAVDLPADQLANYLGGSTTVDGSTLLKPLRRGELVPAAWVTEAQAQPTRFIAVPITSDHAVGGALRPGDRVDVLATFESPRGTAETTVLVQAAEVEGLLRTEGPMMEGDSFGGITLSVAPEDAARIAFALRSAEIDIVRVEGPVETAAEATITAGDL